LYSVVLYGWLKTFGFSVLTVRSLNYVLVAAASVLLWLGTLRLGLLRHRGTRLGLVLLMLTAASPMYLARYGRVDALTLLLASATFLALSIPHARWRTAAMFALAALYPVAGHQLVAFAGVMCVLLFIFLGRAFQRTALLLAGGCLTGLLVLLAFYAFHGVMMTFLTTSVLSTHVVFGDVGRMVKGDQDVYGRLHSRLENLRSLWKSYFVDPSFLPVLVALGVANLWQLVRNRRLERSVPLFGLAVALLLPPIVLNLGKYNFYYTWMGCVPAAVCACRAIEELSGAAVPRYLLCTLLGYAGAVGFPLRLYETSAAERQEFAHIEKFVQEAVRPDDWVYGDAAIYYTAKKRAARYFYSYAYATNKRRLPEIPADERQRITVLIVPVDRFQWAAGRVGGEWAPTGEELVLGDVRFEEVWETLNPQLITAPEIERWKPTLGVYRRRLHKR
jgi:hypothetical protein